MVRLATRSHKILQTKAAGRTGKKEMPLPSGRLVDAITRTGILREIERSRQGIPRAVSRLKEGIEKGIGRKAEIRVHADNVNVAFDQMRHQRVRGNIVPIGSPRNSVYVPKRRKSTRH